MAWMYSYIFHGMSGKIQITVGLRMQPVVVTKESDGRCLGCYISKYAILRSIQFPLYLWKEASLRSYPLQCGEGSLRFSSTVIYDSKTTLTYYVSKPAMSLFILEMQDYFLVRNINILCSKLYKENKSTVINTPPDFISQKVSSTVFKRD